MNSLLIFTLLLSSLVMIHGLHKQCGCCRGSSTDKCKEMGGEKCSVNGRCYAVIGSSFSYDSAKAACQRKDPRLDIWERTSDPLKAHNICLNDPRIRNTAYYFFKRTNEDVCSWAAVRDDGTLAETNETENCPLGATFLCEFYL